MARPALIGTETAVAADGIGGLIEAPLAEAVDHGHAEVGGVGLPVAALRGAPDGAVVGKGSLPAQR
jgi:hypothetical protein